MVHVPLRIGVVPVQLPGGQRQSLGDDHVGGAQLLRKGCLPVEQREVRGFPRSGIIRAARRRCRLRRQVAGDKGINQHQR